MTNLNKKFVIFTAIILALVISSFLNSTVFLANSPKIRSDLADRIFNFSKSIALLIQKNNTTTTNTKQEMVFQQISKGVYAEESGNNVNYTVKINEIDWVYENYVTKSGKKVTLAYPRGQRMSDDLLQRIYP